jgi:hypothetical protein
MKRLSVSPRLQTFLGSKSFFRLIVVLFVLQALWIALSALYPMPFDEEFHLGLIRLYAHHPSPFWSAHPSNGDAFGALTRDPSYLSHYLMSFVYKFIALFTSSETVQIIILRLINIGFFATSLPLFRRLLSKSGASSMAINVCLMVFVLVPIVPLLAAHINYDNVIMPLVALALILTHGFITKLRQNRNFDANTLILLTIVCLAASIIKYAFLPIFLAVVGIIGYHLLRMYGLNMGIIRAFAASFKAITRVRQILLVALLILFGGLFVERIGINMVRYHDPSPDCGSVLSVKQCSAYGPWNRDYHLNLNKGDDAPVSPLTFNYEWLRGMWLRSFFTLAGPTVGYQTKGPLVMPARGVLVFAMIGLLLLTIHAKKIFKLYDKTALWLFLLVPVIYIVFLWLDEYRLFLHAGKAVAINGRYLLIVLPMVLLLVALAYQEALRRHRTTALLAACLVMLTFAWGGGALTFILRSNDSWYWPNSTVHEVHQSVQSKLGPLVPGYRNPSQFLR